VRAQPDTCHARGIGAGDVRDQRIEGRPPFGRVEARNGLAIARIGAEPVDRLSREGREPARRKAACRSVNRVGVGR
jgi:hypothetical protein